MVRTVDASNLQSASSSQIDSSKDPQQYILKDLTPGATYQLQLFTVYDLKESVAYISKNFTTSKCTNIINILFCLNYFIIFYFIMIGI